MSGLIDGATVPNTPEERRHASLVVVSLLGLEARPVLEALGLVKPKRPSAPV